MDVGVNAHFSAHLTTTENEQFIATNLGYSESEYA